MLEDDFATKVSSRTTEENTARIGSALADAGLLANLHFLKDGLSTSVFEIEGSNLLLKVFDKRMQKNPRINHSRFIPHPLFHQVIQDESVKDDKGRPVTVEIELVPKLHSEGITPLHQEMLRYKLWTEEGLDFWDRLPAASAPKEIKNVLLDHRGAPYQIDADAVMPFRDMFNEYPANADGKRTDAQYLHYRADSFDEYGKPDTIPLNKFDKIVEACKSCSWPSNQAKIFDDYVDGSTLAAYKKAFSSTQSLQASR